MFVYICEYNIFTKLVQIVIRVKFNTIVRGWGMMNCGRKSVRVASGIQGRGQGRSGAAEEGIVQRLIRL